RSYSDYKHAITDLKEAIGDYCSYCERQIETNLAVEHVTPKSRADELRNEWSNFLLGCVNCNSCKGTKSHPATAVFRPDRDNTLRIVSYTSADVVTPHPALSSRDRDRAMRTIELVGLDRRPGHPRYRKGDGRWQTRKNVWEIAHRYLHRLQGQDTLMLRESIVDIALGRGLFSIWMTVFEDDTDMRRRLIAAFRGTATDCFDATTFASIPRPGGQI
ncbi:MAG: HNH endonuclease, partial [Bacteroidota bacterium]